jgi:N6-L-threonylcarbamoyladenine synthase
MLILGIETSCDETSAAVVEDGTKIISHVIFSQIEEHKKFGGVAPEVASRKHIENIGEAVDRALEKTELREIDAVAVTYGPGLVGALLVGISYAKGICLATKTPLIGVNHIAGHISANFLENDFEPPFICLAVSGGHTLLVKVNDYADFELIGTTIDDAAGEAFDKIGRALELGYPGGPAVERAARRGDPNAIFFPRAKTAKYDFSFSGLKSAVLNYLRASKNAASFSAADVAASFQRAVVEVLVEKTKRLSEELKIDKVALAGGVACNELLRKRMKESFETVSVPPPILCSDNAAMIAGAGFFSKNYCDLSLNAVPSLKI